MLIALRTAPYHSWKNPCERVNCILNIGLQSIGLMRSPMSEGYENLMKSSSSMNAIRKEAEANPMLQDALHDSLESVKLLMSTTFQRLVLKDVPYEAASQHQMSGLWNCVGDMNPKLKPDMKAKKDISGCPDLKAFIDHALLSNQALCLFYQEVWKT